MLTKLSIGFTPSVPVDASEFWYSRDPNMKWGDTDPKAAMENRNIPHAIHLGRWPRPAKYVSSSDVQICPISLKFSNSAMCADFT
jgi:hypothetical protein